LTMIPAGCVEKSVIDDVNIATGVGIDKSGDQLLGSIMIPVFNPDKSFDNFTFTAKGKVFRDLISEMQKKASQPIVSGSLDLAFIGKDIARRGILPVLDVFLRDPTVGSRLHIAIVDGKAVDIFEGKYGDRGNGEYLKQLMEHNMSYQNLPRTNLHLFLAAYYQKGQDPYLPILKKVQKDLVTITGIALFKDEKLVDILSDKKMFYFKLLVDKHTRGSVKIKNKHGESSIESIHSDEKIKLVKRNPYEFTVHISINGFLTEHQNRSFKKSDIHRIEKQLEKQVVQECQNLIKNFQKHKIDPVGFGHIAKTQTRNFDFQKWYENYHNAKFKITAKVAINEVGVIE